MQPNLTDQRRQFLATVFEGLPGWIEIRSLSRNGLPAQVFCRDIQAGLHTISEHFHTGLNVYAGMATRHSGESGGKANLVRCRVLWVDRDGLTEEGAREEWETALERFPIQPSLRVDSGGGEHAHWILEEPLDLTDADQIQLLEHTLKGLADALECDPAPTDASRIMRVPGTINLPSPEKQAAGRIDAPCRIISQTGEVYSIEDFEDFTTRGAQLKNTAPRTTKPADATGALFRHPYRHEALKRHAAFLRKSGLSVSAVEAALLVFNDERCDPPKEPAEVANIARWSGCVDVGDNNAAEVELDPHAAERGYVERMKSELVTSVTTGHPLQKMQLNFEESRLAPRYPSAVDGLETYGNTVLLAEGGVGKTMLAHGIALEAAGCGAWEVVYFNAELDEAELAERIKRYGQNMVNDWGCALDHIVWWSAGDQTSIGGMVDTCVDAVSHRRKLLIVLDSINTLAEYAAGDAPGADLAQLRKLYNWSAQVRKQTLGDVAFLIVSETNASGGVKGRKGFFSADVVVSMKSIEESDSVEINVLKSRSARGGNLGAYTRDWKTGRFVK